MGRLIQRTTLSTCLVSAATAAALVHARFVRAVAGLFLLLEGVQLRRPRSASRFNTSMRAFASMTAKLKFAALALQVRLSLHLLAPFLLLPLPSQRPHQHREKCPVPQSSSSTSVRR